MPEDKHAGKHNSRNTDAPTGVNPAIIAATTDSDTISKQRRNDSASKASAGIPTKPRRATRTGNSGTSQPAASNHRTASNRGSGDDRPADNLRTGTGDDRGTNSEPSPIEVPQVAIRVKRKYNKRTKHEDKASEITVLSLLAIACDALYSTASLFGGEHWELNDQEVTSLSKATKTALDTLPESTYANIEKVIQQYIPWVNLGIVAIAITAPRIQQSIAAKREVARNSPAAHKQDGQNNANGRATPDYYGDSSNGGFGATIVDFDGTRHVQ